MSNQIVRNSILGIFILFSNLFCQDYAIQQSLNHKWSSSLGLVLNANDEKFNLNTSWIPGYELKLNNTRIKPLINIGILQDGWGDHNTDEERWRYKSQYIQIGAMVPLVRNTKLIMEGNLSAGVGHYEMNSSERTNDHDGLDGLFSAKLQLRYSRLNVDYQLMRSLRAHRPISILSIGYSTNNGLVAILAPALLIIGWISFWSSFGIM